MKRKANILIVDDDRDVLESARMFLKQEYTGIDLLDDPAQIPKFISQKPYDVILLDMNFRKGLNDGSEGFYWLERIREFDPMAVIVLITAYGEVDLAVKAMKNGATDFVLKPWKNQKLLGTINTALELHSNRRTNDRLTKTNKLYHEDTFAELEFIGTSSSIVRVKDLIRRVADTDANILILGENGTGKELVARSLHKYSSRSGQPFIQVDLGTLSHGLMESELFGHVKGAFTDAREDRTGRIEIANSGTLFLDEIGNIGPKEQQKLLSVLQQKVITPVGSTRKIDVNFRLICATNANIYNRVKMKEFREDLLYRINTVEINLPPLRERSSDIPELALFFARKYSAKYKKEIRKITPEVMRTMKSYNWPGNIRELRHSIERAVILATNDALDNPDIFRTEAASRQSDNPDTSMTLDEMEKQHIIAVLDANEGNVTRAAKSLGITRTAMYRRLNKYRILTRE